MKKKIMPCVYLYKGKAVKGFENTEVAWDGKVSALGTFYGDNGADGVVVFDLSEGDEEHEEALLQMKEIMDCSEVPVFCAGNVRRVEDVKKILYAGCERAFLNLSKESNLLLLEEVSKRFGKEKIGVCIGNVEEYRANRELIGSFAGVMLCLHGAYEEIRRGMECSQVDGIDEGLQVLLYEDFVSGQEEFFRLLQTDGIAGVAGDFVSDRSVSIMDLKAICKRLGIDVWRLVCSVNWGELKLNGDGMIPVVVQDYKTDEVLMLAYMNEEAFGVTLETGKMTYWSRSRDELWTKGLTSGHVQYVKALYLDCDGDTLLAKVSQVGAACHTGNPTCFFNEVVRKEYRENNPLKVFQEVYNVILDRKEHPKEGSYTNYLFEKGIDKILKKVGEECTEIVIAAKNPEKEEIKYEIADFLYHVMVLMAEKGVSWEDITRELAHR